MARTDGSRFGELSQRFVVRVTEPSTNNCTAIARDIEVTEALISSFQQMLIQFPSAKGDLLESIIEAQQRLAALNRQKERLNCPEIA